MPAQPDPNYDIVSALYAFAPGVEAQREIVDGLAAAYEAGGFVPLTEAQVLAVTGPLPAYPTGLKLFADSNPDPFDGWSVDQQDAATGMGRV